MYVLFVLLGYFLYRKENYLVLENCKTLVNTTENLVSDSKPFKMKNTFPKKERLFGAKRIERLYKVGKAFVAYPFRVVFLLVLDENETIPARVMVSVSKKKFKKAVDRNRIKRLMREAYRLNKSELVCFAIENNLKIHISFQYISDEILDFDEVNLKTQKALNKLIQTISNNN